MAAQQEIAKLLLKERLQSVTVNNAWARLTAPEKAAAVEALRAGNTNKLGKILVGSARQWARGQSITRAGEILADGELSAAELTEVFG